MGQLVAISSIYTDRTLEPGDDLTALAKHIRDSGLKVPILVTHEYELIDGLRRLEAMRSLGHDTVEVVPASLFPQMCMWLKRAMDYKVEAKPLTPRRIWDIYRVTKPLMNITRSHVQRGRRKGQRGQSMGGRQLLADALGLSSESFFQASTQLYRAAAEDPTEVGDLARTEVERLERGETTVYMAVERMKIPRRRGDIVRLEDQRNALQATVVTLGGLGHGLDRLGPLNKEFKQDEVEEYLIALRAFRRKIYQVIHRLEQENNNK